MPSSSKLNLIKSFVRKKFLDTFIFKSYKLDKEISNSIQGINNNNDINNNNNIVHRKSIALPILISNQSLEDDCEQNKCLSEEVDGNYESNYDDDDDNLDNNHCLPLSILLMKLNVEEHFNIDVISLLNTTHQWFKAEDGVGCSETTREISFCDRAIL
ncbi:hypothetical protein RhiirA1_477055 [Rhizophagus irregularis]|uniref:Uncharacterized protein n=1 Tax=Rhizophagus irregularis TaxID=588596 RepID=A0A2N0QU40_9GLOM|nr:hypothetical protein RhiirA1_477055 [Rhizophagus irregularis]